MQSRRKERAVIFKRKPTYLMEMSAEINFPLEEMGAESEEFAALSEDDRRAVFADSLVRQVGEVAGKELTSHGQTLKSASQSSAHLTVNELGEYWVDFSVAFKGDREGAVRAVEKCAERVRTLGGIAQITHVSLRGTDGTYEHAFRDETVATAESGRRGNACVDRPSHGSRPRQGRLGSP
jgi:hypothetical protein